MAVATKSRSSLDKEKCNFNKLVLNRVLCLVFFRFVNLPLTPNSTSEKLIDK